MIVVSDSAGHDKSVKHALRIRTNLISVTILKISLVILLTMFSSMICKHNPYPSLPRPAYSHCV